MVFAQQTDRDRAPLGRLADARLVPPEIEVKCSAGAAPQNEAAGALARQLGRCRPTRACRRAPERRENHLCKAGAPGTRVGTVAEIDQKIATQVRAVPLRWHDV